MVDQVKELTVLVEEHEFFEWLEGQEEQHDHDMAHVWDNQMIEAMGLDQGPEDQGEA